VVTHLKCHSLLHAARSHTKAPRCVPSTIWARASAIVYSIVEMAGENGLIPFEYLRYLFERLPNLGDGDPDELLPWSPSLPEACRTANRPEPSALIHKGCFVRKVGAV